MTHKKIDNLYQEPQDIVGGFVFDSKVADVFPDMINRSVPAYNTIVDMTSLFAARYAQPGTNCYDLGCSLGATSMAIAKAVAGRGCRIIAVDSSEAMLQKFGEQSGDAISDLELVHGDVRSTPIERASLVALNFTLQFLPPGDRGPLLENIFHGMLPGSCLVLSEKVRFDTKNEEQFHDRMHTAFKRANGYSDLEVSQKRAALENVLIKETIDAHLARLKGAGFAHAWTWFQCFNFISIIALRD